MLGGTPGGMNLDFTQPEEELIPAEPQEEKSSAWIQFIRDLFETIILAVVLFIAINAVSARVRVDGFSMRPTLQDGEYILVNRLAFNNGLPERGDIIVFQSPLNDQDLIKRVIGLPGETVQIFDGKVSVNGNVLSEAYIAAAPVYNGEWSVPADHLFVLGDNRNDSSDSHAWGLLPAENVIGKALLIYWPPPEWGVLTHVATGAQ